MNSLGPLGDFATLEIHVLPLTLQGVVADSPVFENAEIKMDWRAVER